MRPWIASRWPLVAPGLRVLLGMALAVAVGYLLEKGLLDGWTTLVLPSNLWLFVVGIAAALLSSWWWFRDLQASSDTGVFFHVAIEDRSDRPEAQDMRLRSWATSTWEYARVMPFIRGDATAVRGGDCWDEIDRVSARLAAQVRHSAELVPGAKSVSVLYDGPTEFAAPIGARLARELTDGRSLRMVTDIAGDGTGPFITFPVPTVHPPAGEPAALPGPGVPATPHHEIIYRPDAAVSMAAADPRNECGVLHPLPLAERADAYQEVLGALGDKLQEVARSGTTQRVIVSGSGPVAIAVGGGYMAGKLDLEVGVAQFDRSTGQYDGHTWATDDRDDWEKAPRREGSSALSHRYRAWLWLALIRSGGLGFMLPLLAASVALVLEWGVAQSTDAPLSAWWCLLGILCIAAAIIVIGGMLLRRRLFLPTVTLLAGNRARSTFAERVVEVTPLSGATARTSGPDPLRDWARALTAAQTEVLVALPEVEDVVVDVTALPFGAQLVHDPVHGLRKALRGNEPIVLLWRDGDRRRTCLTGPAVCPCGFTPMAETRGRAGDGVPGAGN